MKQKVDLRQDSLSISINQQGDRLGTYKSMLGEKYEPSDFNIALIKTGAGSEGGEIIKCELANWF